MTEVAIFCISDANYMHFNLGQSRFNVSRKHQWFSPLSASPGPLIACILEIISKALH